MINSKKQDLKKAVLISLLILLILFPYLVIKKQVCYASFSGKAMCVLEKDSNRVLYSQNMHECLPMASTTKVVTAITVIENCKDLEQYIQVDDEAIGVEGSSIYLRKGELIKVKDLLYGLMLRSGNDAATALAIHVGGDVSGFAIMMNNLAEKVGATNSHFCNPHGLDNKGHFTSAYDLALITAYALNNPVFKQVVSTKNYVIEETNKSEKRFLTNKNKLLSTLEGCCGVKTGFTSRAGRCLVSASERNNTTIVCVVLNCGPMFEESADYINLAFNEYENVKIIDKNIEVYNEYIIDEVSGKLFLYPDEDFYYPLKDNEKDKLKLLYKVNLDNAEIGDIVGEIEIYLDKHLLKTIKLVTMNKIDKLIDSNTLKISELLWEEKLNENK